jgi:hypothetical protein
VCHLSEGRVHVRSVHGSGLGTGADLGPHAKGHKQRGTSKGAQAKEAKGHTAHTIYIIIDKLNIHTGILYIYIKSLHASEYNGSTGNKVHESAFSRN